MKTLLLAIAAAGVSGCAVYPSPGNEAYGGSPTPYVLEQPVYIQGGVSYGNYSPSYVYRRGYYRGYRGNPGYVPRQWTRPDAHAVRPGHRPGDRDPTGVQNRHRRDRDDDGVRNRHDHRPNDSGRR